MTRLARWVDRPPHLAGVCLRRATTGIIWRAVHAYAALRAALCQAAVLLCCGCSESSSARRLRRVSSTSSRKAAGGSAAKTLRCSCTTSRRARRALARVLALLRQRQRYDQQKQRSATQRSAAHRRLYSLEDADSAITVLCCSRVPLLRNRTRRRAHRCWTI